MEYVILIIVIAVLAVGTGGWLLFVRRAAGGTLRRRARPRSGLLGRARIWRRGGGGTAPARKPRPPRPRAQIERPPPSAGRLVRRRAQVVGSQSWWVRRC